MSNYIDLGCYSSDLVGQKKTLSNMCVRDVSADFYGLFIAFPHSQITAIHDASSRVRFTSCA